MAMNSWKAGVTCMPPERNDRNDSAYLSWKGWEQESFGNFSRKDSVYYSLELKQSGIRIDKRSAVLEIGFGNGSFCGWTRNFTEHYVGIEANQQLLERARLAGIEAYPADQPLDQCLAGHQFDLIAIFDVLEHLDIESIINLLRSCRDHLAPDGIILFRVPSGDSPFSGPLINGDITHRTLLGRRAVEQLATMLALNVVAVRGQAFPVLGMGFGMALNRSAIVAVRAITSRLVNAIYNGNEKMVVDLNLVALLKK